MACLPAGHHRHRSSSTGKVRRLRSQPHPQHLGIARPAVIVLLDADDEGRKARDVLLSGGPRDERLVAADHILLLDDKRLEALSTGNPDGVASIEDLIPLPIAIAAVHRYYSEFAGKEIEKFTPAKTEVFKDGCHTLRGLEAALRRHLDDVNAHVDKIGFARSVIEEIEANGAQHAIAHPQAVANFRLLLGQLARLQRDADRDASSERISKRVRRETKRFLSEHPASARREEVLVLIELIQRQLDVSLEAEEVLATMRGWSHTYGLDTDPGADIENFEGFREDLRGLAYAGARAVQATQQPAVLP